MRFSENPRSGSLAPVEAQGERLLLSWLHVSDIHFGHGNAGFIAVQAEPDLRSVLRDLHNNAFQGLRWRVLITHHREVRLHAVVSANIS